MVLDMAFEPSASARAAARKRLLDGAARQARAPSRVAREVFSYSLSLLEAERQWLATRAQVPHDRQD